MIRYSMSRLVGQLPCVGGADQERPQLPRSLKLMTGLLVSHQAPWAARKKKPCTTLAVQLLQHAQPPSYSLVQTPAYCC